MTQPQPLIDPSSLRTIGAGLERPESVNCLPDGSLAVSHRGRGISRVSLDGAVTTLGPDPAIAGGAELVPNGISPQPDGSFLIANIGEGGGIWRLSTAGELTPWLMSVEGVDLAAANFVMRDAQGRIWVTVSTISRPRFAAYSDKVADGLVILVDDKGPRILADDICFANECRLTPDATGLMVSETFARRVTRFGLADGAFTGRDTFAQFGRGDFPDGIRHDARGRLWVTCIVSNRLWRIAPGGTPTLMLADVDPDHVDRVETALSEGRMGREHFYETGKSRLGNIASIEFSADGAVAYLGSLCGTSILALPTHDGDSA